MVNILAERTWPRLGNMLPPLPLPPSPIPCPRDNKTMAVSENETNSDEKNNSSSSEAEADASASTTPPPSPSPSPSPPQKILLPVPRQLSTLSITYTRYYASSRLQYGMDVNPKLTSGPTGVDTTSMTCSVTSSCVDCRMSRRKRNWG